MQTTSQQQSTRNRWQPDVRAFALLASICVIPAACGAEAPPAGPDDSRTGTAGAVAAVELTPGQVALRPGESLTLSATPLDAEGQHISGVRVTWSSSDPAIASLSADGLLIAHVPGAVKVTASAGDVSGQVTVTVLAPVARVNVQPGTIDLRRGRFIIVQAQLTDAEGNDLADRTVTWLSDDPAVATVSTTGRVEGVGKGSTTLRAESEGMSGTATIRVQALDFASVTSGMGHTCALAVDGTAWCWGANEHGQLGTGDKSPSTVPLPVAGGLTFTSIAAGAGYTCAVTPNGQGYCWGDNSMMELGNRQAGKTSATPVPVLSAPAFASTGGASNMAHTCALTTTQAAYCWGYNRFGMVGNGSVRDEPYPLAVVGGLSFSSISAAHMRTCGVALDGSVYCWGRGGRIQLGNAAAPLDLCDGFECSMSPRALGDGQRYSSVSTGRVHTCAIADDGSLHCWGENSFGQVGDGTFSDAGAPMAVEAGRRFTLVSAGDSHTCGLLGDGRAMCWGLDQDGRSGTGTGQWSPLPAFVSGNIRFHTLSAGYTHTCGVSTDAALYCWGDNMMGQLGDGTDIARLTPVRVAEP